VPVAEDVNADGVVDMQRLPAGPYAVFRARFTRVMSLVAWEQFMQNWLVPSEYQLDFRPSDEIYLPIRDNSLGDTLVADLCLSIRDESSLM